MARSRRNTVRRRLASGEIKTYTYVGDRPVEPEKAHTMADLILAYRGSSTVKPAHAWSKLSLGTQHAYRCALTKLDALRGVPLALIGSEHIEMVREELSGTPGMANVTLAVMQAMFKIAKKRKWVAANPVAGIERFETDEGEPWPQWAIDHFREKAPADWVFAVDLALMTAQRRGDLVKARWSDYDGRGIEFLQQKTGSRVYLPVPSLVDELNARRKAATGLTIISGRFGRPYTPHGFSTAWVRTMEAIGLHGKGLKFHGLRHTALTWMAERGATEYELMSVSGHRNASQVKRYTKRANQRKMAERAVAYLPVLAKRQNEGG